MAWACPLNGPGSHPQDRPQMDATWKKKARRARTTWGRTAIAELKEMGSHGVRHSMLQRIGPVGYKSLKPYASPERKMTKRILNTTHLGSLEAFSSWRQTH